MLDLSRFKTLAFDCDGVVLDSNKLKTSAFYQATLPFGPAAAQAMVDYHVANGGVSRYKKFAYFVEHIVPKNSKLHPPRDLMTLLRDYSLHVRSGLLHCTVAPGLTSLRQQTNDARWLIVSGGDQNELRDVFAKRGITKLFDAGIFGSPDTKLDILDRELTLCNIQHPVLFLGDSKYDYQVALQMGLQFVFMSSWSEVTDWQTWVNDSGLAHTQSIESLLTY